MKRYELIKIDILSAARIYLVFGLVIGLIFTIPTLLFLPLDAHNTLISIFGFFFFLSLYALLGAGTLSLLIWLYNFVANRVGGVVIYTKEETYITPGPAEKTSRDDPKLK